MIGLYDASHHPEVQQGKKTENQVFQEFLRTFQQHHECRFNNAPDNIVTREEFLEYYNNISCSIDDDRYFELMMNSAWNLDGSRVTKQGWASAPEKKQPDGHWHIPNRKPDVSPYKQVNMWVPNTPQKTNPITHAAITPQKQATMAHSAMKAPPMSARAPPMSAKNATAPKLDFNTMVGQR